MTCRHTGTVYQCVLLGAFVSRFRNALESGRINYVAVVGAGDEAPEGRWFRERKERGEAGDHSVCQAQRGAWPLVVGSFSLFCRRLLKP